MKKFSSGFTQEQQAQIEKQLKDHQHERYEIDLTLTEDTKLKGFVVLPHILRPERMVALSMAQYLYTHPEYYVGKTVLDMGCGSGIQGITTIMGGAERVVFSDISPDAVKNTTLNVEKFKLNDNALVVQGDLFENVDVEADLIIFNHPFFSGKPMVDEPASITMLDEGELLRRFLKEAPGYLTENGVIVMPYFELAGAVNNPTVQAPLYGYEVEELERKEVMAGTQNGEMFLVKLGCENG